MIVLDNEPYQQVTAEGRAVYEEDEWHHEFEYRDQVGNLRVGFRNRDGSLQKTQASDYTPFGIPFNQKLYGQKKDNFTYHGHEDQGDFDINMIGMQARCYNPTIGRFLSVDPLADQMTSWSPYNYTMNNPINMIDPDGRAPYTIFEDEDGNILHETNDGNNHTVTISNSNIEAFQQSVNEYSGTVSEPSIDSEKQLAQSLYNDFAQSGETLSEVYQVGFTGNATAGIGVNLSIGVAWDSQGNVDGYFSIGGSLGGDLTGGIEATRNMSGGFINVSDLKGESTMSTLGVWFADFGKGGDVGGSYPKTLSSPTNTLYSSKSSGLSLGLPIGWTKTLESTVLFNR